jgi:hypothetical protein
MMFAHSGEFADFRPFRSQRKEAAIAPTAAAMLDSAAMSASASKLFGISRSAPGLGLLALLLRR